MRASFFRGSMGGRMKEMAETLKTDPGNPMFADYAGELVREQQYLEALIVCLSGLSANPGCHPGRLMLARVFYSLGFRPFAVREVEALQKDFPESDRLRRLLEKISGGVVGARLSDKETESETLAESEFDLGDLDVLAENSGKDKA